MNDLEKLDPEKFQTPTLGRNKMASRSSLPSSSSTAASTTEEQPMVDEATARAWLARQGFAVGDLRSEIIIDQQMKYPMAWATGSFRR